MTDSPDNVYNGERYLKDFVQKRIFVALKTCKTMIQAQAACDQVAAQLTEYFTKAGTPPPRAMTITITNNLRYPKVKIGFVPEGEEFVI